MKAFQNIIVCLLLSSFVQAQEIRLYQKPFDYKKLPPVFVAMDTLTYSRLADYQQITDALIAHQRTALQNYAAQVSLLKLSNGTLQESLQVAQAYSESKEIELQLKQSELRATRRRGHRNNLVFGLSGFVAGVLVGIIAR